MVRNAREYTEDDIAILLQGVRERATLSDLERILNRSGNGIVMKLITLAKTEPYKFDTSVIKGYQREVKRQYYQEHSDKVRQKNKRYNWRNRHAIREQKRLYYQRNADRIKARTNRRSQTHKEEILERSRRSKERKRKSYLIGEVRHGYDIREVTKRKDFIVIGFQEDGIYMPYAKRDFRIHVREAMKRLNMEHLRSMVDIDYKGDYLIISINPSNGLLEDFLATYAISLKNERH